MRSAYQRQPAEMNSNKIASERQRFSTESSRASFSSSRSSSFSTVDYCRRNQPDPASNDRIKFPEAAFEDSRCSMSPSLARQSANFRDIVKDSLIKEARGLSKIPTHREENMSRAAKQRDILMNSILSETVDGVGNNGNQNASVIIKESVKGLSNLHGTSWQYDQHEEQRMQSGYGYKFNEASRISYDAMETSRFSFESRETLSASKLRDLPRLSLDSRHCLMRHGEYDSLSNSRLKASLKRSCSTNDKGQNMREVLGTERPRPPCLVAKLMGLTELPYATSGSENGKVLIKNCSVQDEFDAFTSAGHKKPILDSTFPSFKKEPVSSGWVTSEMKPISSSGILVVPAPWKKTDGGVSSLKQASRHVRSPMRQPNPFPSVYSEIEKRFKDIEFDKSGKDLRALKQILKSIHAKGLLKNERQEHASTAATGRKHVSALTKSNLKKVTGGPNNARGKHLTEVTSWDDNSSRRLDSPIVIMKPISRPPRSEITRNMNKDHAVSSDEKFKSVQHSTRPRQQPKDNTASSPRNLGSVSPRNHIKKPELDKQIQAHSSDANKNKVQVSKKLTGSNSSGDKLQQKCSNLQQNSSQVREILLDIKKLRSRENEASLLPSDGYATLDPKQDRDATRSVRSSKFNGSRSPSKRASKPAVLASDHLSDPPSLPVQLDEVSPEHPSPVSVLNTSGYMDDMTMEEKHLTTPPKDVAENYTAEKSTLSSEEAFSLVISRRKLLSIDSLVQKLKRLNSTHDESKTDYIAVLGDDTSPDNRYISEILLASGLLLREFSSSARNAVQLHPSGNLINPELFNVLEQTNSNDHRSNEDTISSKSNRKLIFDTLNEILTKKLASNASLADYYSLEHQKLARKALNTQNLIKELCREMEELQPRKKRECWWSEEDEKVNGGDAAARDMLWEDVMQQRSDGMFECRISDVVLDIERLIFKDMVDEIVMGDCVAYRSRPKVRKWGSSRTSRSRTMLSLVSSLPYSI